MPRIRRAGERANRGCPDSRSQVPSLGQSGAARFANPARPAARAAVGVARDGRSRRRRRRAARCPTSRSGSTRWTSRASPPIPGRRSRPRRRPDRPGGAAAADRCGAAGDPAALPRRRLRAHHRLGRISTRNGQLRFVVTEGRIASVKLDGDIGPAGTQVLRFLNRLTEKQPIDSATLERYLLLAQDVPGVTLRAVLEPSTDQPGALNLIAQVSRQAVSGLATIDNRAFNADRADRDPRPARLQQLHRVRREDRDLAATTRCPTARISARPRLETFIGALGPEGEALWRLRARPSRPAAWRRSAITAPPRCSAARSAIR